MERRDLTSIPHITFMPSYITRVELHSGTADDYQVLNSAMETTGFSRAIQANDGSSLLLPTGQYVGNGECAATDVLQLAQRAALTTKKGFAVFVSDVNNAAWFGLDPVQRPANSQ
jgi:hypothetical protein